MMLIEADLYTEGHNPDVQQLTHRLKEFFEQEHFANGLDWATQRYWAKMSMEQYFLFILKYPQYLNRFKRV